MALDDILGRDPSGKLPLNFKTPFGTVGVGFEDGGIVVRNPFNDEIVDGHAAFDPFGTAGAKVGLAVGEFIKGSDASSGGTGATPAASLGLAVGQAIRGALDQPPGKPCPTDDDRCSDGSRCGKRSAASRGPTTGYD